MLMMLGFLFLGVQSWNVMFLAELQNYTTIQSVGTFAFGIAFVSGLTQYLKNIKFNGKVMKCDPKLLAGIIALIFSALLQFLVYKDTTGEGLFTGLCNSFILTFGAVAAYESAIKPTTQAIQKRKSLKQQSDISK